MACLAVARLAVPDLLMEFEWDTDMAELNWRRHGVAFDVATSVFDDPFVIEVDDPELSEYRQRAIGYADGRLLLVVYTMRDDICRIISARSADTRERRRYHEAGRD